MHLIKPQIDKIKHLIEVHLPDISASQLGRIMYDIENEFLAENVLDRYKEFESEMKHLRQDMTDLKYFVLSSKKK